MSFPTPHLSVIQSTLVAVISTLAVGGAVVLVAVATVVLMHRRIAKRPIG